jgi:MFS transporter, DHA2 family, multidrug resistance protein
VAVALGFAILAVGLVMGALTSPGDGSGYVMVWLAVAGLGLGVCLPTVMDAALGALSPEHGGVGSALIQAVRMVGGAFGAAILGSVINATYRGHLHLDGLPAQAAAAVRDSVAAGVAVAKQAGSAELLAMVRDAFIHGMDTALLVCAGVTAAGVILALLFLPRRETATAGAGVDARVPGDDARTDAAAEAAFAVAADPALSRAGSEEVESGHEGTFAVE